MNTKLQKWMPIALCCLPGVAIAAIIGVGIGVGGSAVGAFLSGPLSMGLMMRRHGSSQKTTQNDSQRMADCCAPGEETSTDHLATLRAQRELLERELA